MTCFGCGTMVDVEVRQEGDWPRCPQCYQHFLNFWEENRKKPSGNVPNFSSARLAREADAHARDLLQPYVYDRGARDMVPSRDFIKEYPDSARAMFTQEEMSDAR